MIPLLWIAVLFFLTFFTSGKARRVTVLTDATPVAPGRYALARCAAALVGTGLLALVCLIEAAIFYGRYFDWYGWDELALPALVTLIPPLMLALGSGWLLGRIRSYLIYTWMLVPFVLMVLPLPEFLGLLNGSIFMDRPLTFDILDPTFSLPIGTIVTQCALSLIGIALLMIRPLNHKIR